MSYKCCVFDLDGTLLNTIDTIAYYANEALNRKGFAPIDIPTYKYLVGDGARVLAKRMLAHHGCTDEKMCDELYEDYRTSYDVDVNYKTSVYDGIKELLTALKAKGIKLAVCSNKPDFAAKEAIKSFFGKDCFDVCTGAVDEIPKKPDPHMLNVILDKFGVKAGECIYVGDTDTDMKTGKNAGACTVGVLWGFRERKELIENGADVIVSHPIEILDLLNE